MTALARTTNVRRQAESEQYRIAIVGAGPRGLHTLESLAAAHAEQVIERPVEVTFYEPADTPGAGAVYSPKQPPWLRMNFPAAKLSAWSAQSDNMAGRFGFVDWCHRNGHGEINGSDYAPRALVGEYLSASFATLLKQLPNGVSCQVVSQGVTAVEPQSLGVEVEAGDQRLLFDEVVLTTGHGMGGELSDQSEKSWSLASLAGRADELAGKTVAIRGFALTAIDAVMTLTEGQGGRFTYGPSAWRYEPSGREPARMVPFSRTGRPMYAKPEQKVAEDWATWNGWRRFNEKLAELERKHGVIDFHADIRPILLTAADWLAAWSRGEREPHTAQATTQWWRQQVMKAEPVEESWSRSCKIAHGCHPLDLPHAIGEVWRRLYPQLVRLISHGGLSDSSYTAWQRFATTMERVAFGPPAESLGRLLALLHAGRLDTRFLRSPALTEQASGWRIERGSQQLDASVLINAVTVSPKLNAQSGVLGKLVANGWLAIHEKSGGMMTDHFGRPMGQVLTESERLRVFGRATEGWVLGADTLNRDLHPEITNWACELTQKIEAKVSC